MKKLIVVVVMTLFALTAAATVVSAQEDIGTHASCPLCGMDRGKFDFSRILLEYEDGATAGFCSLHCAAADMAVNLDKAPRAIRVGDYGTKQLIDAETAVWVVGGGKPGVMTKRPKWAFSGRSAADAFIKDNGGATASFEEALKFAYEDMYEDTRMIRERRAAKRKAAEGQKSP